MARDTTVLQLADIVPNVQDLVIVTRPDGLTGKATYGQMAEIINQTTYGFMGMPVAKSIAQIRSGSGDQGKHIRVTNSDPGKIAIYLPQDTSSSDDGTTIIVTSDGKRYMLTTYIGLMDQGQYNDNLSF